MKITNKGDRRITPTKLSLCVVTALAAIGTAPASAFVIDTGNPDIKMRFDNQIRYNAGWRMENVNPHYSNAFGTDETELRFKKNDQVINRLDLNTDFDFTYKQVGFRVSGAAWSENAYSDHTHTNPQANAMGVPANAGPGGSYGRYAKRFVTGSSGEILDAFVFGNFDIGSTMLSVKLGQHNLYWGEALYTIADGVAAGQGPLDTVKAGVSPGAEAKELFMPINQLSAQWLLSDKLTLLAQYQFDWKPFRLTPGGTYFASSDGGGNAFGNDPACASTAPAGTCIRSLAAVTPGRHGGDYGVGMKWRPTWLDGVIGAYYRRYDEKLPWSTIQVSPVDPRPALRLSYARNSELFGVTLNKSLGPVSFGSELVYRHNAALNSVSGFLAGSSKGATSGGPALIPLSQTPAYDQVEGARGDTYHLVLNGIWLLPNIFWDGGTLQGELAYQHLDKVTKNASLFYSEDYACKFGYAPGGLGAGKANKGDGCSTKDALAFNMGFTPQWGQVFPSWDLSMPTSFSYGLKGNASTLGGSNQGAYKYSIGVKGVYEGEYEFTLAWIDAHTDYKTVTATAAKGIPGQQIYSTANGSNASAGIVNNHGWLSFTFKASF